MACTAPNSPVSSDLTSPSPTSTSRTSPPPSPHFTSPAPTTDKDRLTTLPPELLLGIISYLPSSSSLLPLSQTNIYLQTFLLTTHAATICNTLITTRHAHAASILSATYRDGWLLPTHEAVLYTERRITRELVRRTGCSCVGCIAFLHSSRSTAASSSDLSLASDLSIRACLKLPCFPTPPATAAYPQTICKAQHLIDSPWKLSMPGPMFLVFLERYEWELETRCAMFDAECKDADAAKRDDEKRRFDFIVGNYSVRRFLEDVEREFEPAAPEGSPVSDGKSKPGLSGRLGLSMRKGWAKGKRIFQVKKKKGQNATRSRDFTPPLFGEIERPDSVTTTVQKHNRSWMTGLLWFYGLQTPPSSPPSENPPQHRPISVTVTSSNQTREKPDPDQEGKAQHPRSALPIPALSASVGSEMTAAQTIGDKTSRNCMAGVVKRMDHMGGKVRQIYQRCKYISGFESLGG